jgi:hypothetical protein
MLLMNWSTATPGKKAMISAYCWLSGSVIGVGADWAVHRYSLDWATAAWMQVSAFTAIGIQYLWLRHRERRVATAK